MKGLVLSCAEDKEYFFEENCHILELSNTPDDSELSIVRVRVEPAATTHLHRLHGVIERYVILEGEGQVELGLQQGQTVTSGNVVVIPALCPQRITNTGNSDLVFLAICTPRFQRECYEDLEVNTSNRDADTSKDTRDSRKGRNSKDSDSIYY